MLTPLIPLQLDFTGEPALIFGKVLMRRWRKSCIDRLYSAIDRRLNAGDVEGY